MTDPSCTDRTAIGFWIESPRGAQWTNQGMTRLVGFIIEGAAINRQYLFRVVVTDDIRDEAEGDLATLAAKAGLDYTIHSPRDAGIEDETYEGLANFANRYVPVSAWISIFPNQPATRLLEAPACAIFPDAIGLAYHDFSEAAWGDEGHTLRWRAMVAEALQTVGNIVTFSQHVADDQVRRFFDVDASRIRVIPHAPPSLDGILPFVKDGKRTDESLFRAACLLRRFASLQGWTYLKDFPFEHCRYVAVSTQDRVTKNIRIVADATERLIRNRGEDFKVLMTAQLHFGSKWTPLPRTIEEAQTQFDVLSMPDLPRDVHAALYHCAELAIHPSVFEGGRGVFPYYEAISVGTPCVMADGPHAREFLVDAPEFAAFVFDPNDADGLADMMVRVSCDRRSVTELQAETYARLCRRDWGTVADEYAEAALSSIRPVSTSRLRHGSARPE